MNDETNKVNSSELLVRCKAHLARIEEMAAKGMNDRRVLMEVARFAGAAYLLRWEAEAEYEMATRAQQTQDRVHRDAAATVGVKS